MIDGARMASPGLFEQALNAYSLSDRIVVSDIRISSRSRGSNEICAERIQ